MSAYREAWRLAWPLILSNLTVPLLGIVDTAVVGHLPEPHHLGAVAIGAAVFNALYFAFVFLRMGTTGLTAQAFGRGDGVELRAALWRGLLSVAVLVALLLLLAPGLLRAAELIFDPTARVAAELRVYVLVRLLGLPAGLALQVALGWLLGLQDARGPMALLILVNGVNIALDLLFVLGFGWGVGGVGAATVVAEYAGLLLAATLVRRALARIAGAASWQDVRRPAAFRRLLAVNRDIFVRSVALQATFLSFTALGSRQGELILAANALLLNFQQVAAFGLDGFAHATQAMVGRQVGAGDQAGLRRAVRANLLCGVLVSLLLGLGFLLGGRAAIALMTGIEAVRAAAASFLPYAAILPPVSVWAFLFDGVFVGATRTAEMRTGMLVALALFGLAALVLVPLLGNHGLWLAFLLFMAARGLWLGLAYLRIEARGPGFIGASGAEVARTA